MPSPRYARNAWIAVCCAALAACSEGTAPTAALVTVDTLLADISSAEAFSSVGLAVGGVPSFAGGMPSADACPYDSSTQRFVCPTVTSDGLTTSMYFQLLDASGTPQSAFNPATTAAIRTVSDLSGTQSSPESEIPMTMTIEGHSERTLSGLLTATRTLNGTGDATVDMTLTFQGETMTTSVRIVETTKDLVLPARGSANRYPQSGSVSFSMSSTDSGFDVSITITFNGTSTATMVVTSNGTKQTCTIDLANPETVPSCS
jgi:hypothetical protein